MEQVSEESQEQRSKRLKSERNRRYKEKNKEKELERNRAYRKQNAEKIAEQRKDKYERNKTEILEKARDNYDLEKKLKKRAYSAKYRKSDYGRRKIKDLYLLRNYKLSLDDFNLMMQQQNESCAICLVKVEDTKNKALVVDHNHLTGEVRGLLCSNCNTGIGLLQESQEVMQRACNYINSQQNR